jgi:flagellar biosynthesis protein FlhG
MYPLSNPERQRTFMQDLCSLEEHTDCVIIDTSAGLTPEIVGFAACADEAMVVTTPEPTAVMDAYAMIKMIHLTNTNARISVIMNSVRIPADADDAVTKLKVAVDRFLTTSFDFLGSIPFDEQVFAAVSRHRALVQEFPKSGAALSVKAIARRMCTNVT